MKWIISGLFAAYIMRELWTLLPDSNRMIRPFLFSKTEISIGFYIFIACQYILFAIFTYLLTRYSGHWFFHIAFAIQILELAEYFAIYNEAWFKIHIRKWAINVNITSIRFIVFAMAIIITSIWKT